MQGLRLIEDVFDDSSRREDMRQRSREAEALDAYSADRDLGRDRLAPLGHSLPSCAACAAGGGRTEPAPASSSHQDGSR